MYSWRLFKDTLNPVSTALGLSIDDTLPLSLSQHGSPPILHLYKFKPSAIVGKYQDIEAALRLDRCRRRGIEYNRRSTGGGTVIMGPKVVALGLGINIDHPGLGKGIERVFESLKQQRELNQNILTEHSVVAIVADMSKLQKILILQLKYCQT